MSPRRPSTGRLAIVIAAFAIAVVDLVTAVHLATSAPAPAGDRVPGRVAVSSPTPAPAASPSPVTTPAPATPAPAAFPGRRAPARPLGRGRPAAAVADHVQRRLGRSRVPAAARGGRRAGLSDGQRAG